MKKLNVPKKQINIRSRLMRGIIMILLLTIILPLLFYNFIPYWAYYLFPATRLWLATNDIAASYGTQDFLSTVKKTEKAYDSTVEIYTKDGVFVYSTYELINYLPNDLAKAKAVDEQYRLDYKVQYGDLSAEKGYLIKAFTDMGFDITFLDCYQYLPSGDRIEVCMQVSQISSVTKIALLVAFLCIMMILVISLLIVSSFIKRFTRPINTMCNITENMAKLDFSKKCPPTSMVEITQLSESINEMSTALDTALSDLQKKNRKLEEDIENERTIDNLRQTFISGISHELKTPIAIIQGYAEGAKMFYDNGNSQAADNYCNIIIEETNRMNSMIMRLLEITKYESGAYEPVNESFCIAELIDDWFERNKAQIADAGVTTKNNIPRDLIGNGDKLILSSVVNNYLSNAMSHVDGDKKIIASCRETKGAYRVFIFNTGKNIAEKDIDKIWTSFYRADKSLSRSQGRFGLGLAIVASIQRLHHQEYGMENVSGGVSFWFDIKKGTEDNHEFSDI